MSKNVKKLDAKDVIKNKDVVFGNLAKINYELDLLRNGIFNLCLSANYVVDLSNGCIEKSTEIAKDVAVLKTKLDDLVKEFNIKFMERTKQSYANVKETKNK